jgi:hypothetical protein
MASTTIIEALASEVRRLTSENAKLEGRERAATGRQAPGPGHRRRALQAECRTAGTVDD